MMQAVSAAKPGAIPVAAQECLMHAVVCRTTPKAMERHTRASIVRPRKLKGQLDQLQLVRQLDVTHAMR